jgi:hypothetical protein
MGIPGLLDLSMGRREISSHILSTLSLKTDGEFHPKLAACTSENITAEISICEMLL